MITKVEQTILAILSSQPSPEQVFALLPSSELQEYVTLLLAYNKERCLSLEEEQELDRYLAIEHQIRMIKAQAYHRHAYSEY